MKTTRFLQIAFLILLAAGAQPAYSAFWQWSKTSATNAAADPTINWAEGMSPSSINDSARAMMARSAEYRDDISGLLTTSGTSSAYTVTTNQNLNPGGTNPTPNDGQLLSITVHVTNAASSTLQADSGTAFPIQSSAGVPVASGTLISGSPYTMRFSTANSAWMLKGFYGNALSVPLGALIAYTGTGVPNSNFAIPTGQCISTTTYAAYWALVGSPASGGCPGGQFALIDIRGSIPAGLDTLNGSPAGRLTTSAAGCGTSMTTIGARCANGNESRTITLAQSPSHFHTGGIYDPGHSHSVSGGRFASASSNNAFYQTNNSPAVSGSNNLITIDAAGTGIRLNSGNGLDTTNTAGSDQPHSITPPIVGFSYVLRVL